MEFTKKTADQTNLDYDNQAAGGANAAWTGTGGTLPGWWKAMTGSEDADMANEMARPFGVNYDAPAPIGASENGFMPSENAFFDGAPATQVESMAAEEAAPYAAGGALGGITGALGVVGGAMSIADGVERFTKTDAKEQDHVHGGLDVAGGLASVAAGGLGIGASGLLGAGAVAACAPMAAVAAPIAAAIGLGVAGDHHAEDMELWGKDKDGNAQGTVEAAWNESQHLGDVADKAFGGGNLGLAAGAVTAGVSTAVLETGAVVADVGLGIDALGASSGMFGTATNADGKTYNMGAFQAMDQVGKGLGDAADDALGIDKDSLGGEILGGGIRALTDIAEAPAALAANAIGGVVGGVEAAGGWIADLF